MQYRINEKIKPNELNFTMENVQKELGRSIQYEIHRSNVDTAKKTACKQLVDYDQFEEMVRGADLKPVKTKDMGQLFDMPEHRGIINYSTASNNFVTKDGEPINLEEDKENQPNSQKEKEKLEEETQKKIKIEIDTAQNFREYKKLFDEIYNDKNKSKENLEKLLQWHREIKDEYFPKIFGFDFDAKYLIKFCNAVNDNLVGNPEANLSDAEYVWSIEFLEKISGLKTFQISIKGILKKAEKHLIKHYAQKLLDREVIEKERADNVIKKFN